MSGKGRRGGGSRGDPSKGEDVRERTVCEQPCGEGVQLPSQTRAFSASGVHPPSASETEQVSVLPWQHSHVSALTDA